MKTNHLDKVGMTWLEQATSRPPDVYSNQLSYIPYSCLKGEISGYSPFERRKDKVNYLQIQIF